MCSNNNHTVPTGREYTLAHIEYLFPCSFFCLSRWVKNYFWRFFSPSSFIAHTQKSILTAREPFVRAMFVVVFASRLQADCCPPFAGLVEMLLLVNLFSGSNGGQSGELSLLGGLALISADSLLVHELSKNFPEQWSHGGRRPTDEACYGLPS